MLELERPRPRPLSARDRPVTTGSPSTRRSIDKSPATRPAIILDPRRCRARQSADCRRKDDRPRLSDLSLVPRLAQTNLPRQNIARVGSITARTDPLHRTSPAARAIRLRQKIKAVDRRRGVRITSENTVEVEAPPGPLSSPRPSACRSMRRRTPSPRLSEEREGPRQRR